MGRFGSDKWVNVLKQLKTLLKIYQFHHMQVDHQNVQWGQILTATTISSLRYISGFKLFHLTV
jgi:hypothetical protein